MYDYKKDTEKIKAKLPEKLRQQSERTLEVMTARTVLSEMEVALYWNTISLSFEYGQERGLQESMKATLDSMRDFGGHKS